MDRSESMSPALARIVLRARWEELTLRPGDLRCLRALAAEAAAGRRAGGPVIVLGGGTGKTLAAAALADAAGVALYRVDVGRVVSRYIGETEKNLDRVFRDVATFRAVLLFDEADALFGKRTDVEDASDRYANLETGYLLERIAAHPGIVILASNMRTAEMEPLIRRARCLLDSGGR